MSFKDQVPIAGLERFFDGVPAGGVWLTFHHEPEPDVDVVRWRAYWRMLRVARDHHRNAGRIRLVAIHTLWSSRHRAGVDWRRWMLPGVADVDGWDCYRDSSFDCYEPVESALALPWQAAEEFGMPWSIPELGAAVCSWDRDGAGRAGWFLEAVEYARRRGCEALGLWCSTTATGWVDYRPHDEATLAVWRSVLAANPR